MYTIKTMNAISPVGLAKLPANQFEINNEANDAQGILVRSADLHDVALPKSLLAIARAGAGLVMDYLQNEVGGLEEMAKINHAKAKVLYDYLDGQDFYNNPVQPEYRSMMNVTFTSPNPDMDKKFCAAATEAGFVNLKGHRLVGGMRASIYNAMPAQGVNDLVDFMEKFRKENA